MSFPPRNLCFDYSSVLSGIPSARNLNFLSNQDFVWSGALMISGAFVALAVIKQGVPGIMNEINMIQDDWQLGRWWTIIIKNFIPYAATFLLGWWLFQAATEFAPEAWFNPFNAFSVMTCLMQWGLILGLLIMLNRYVVRQIRTR